MNSNSLSLTFSTHKANFKQLLVYLKYKEIIIFGISKLIDLTFKLLDVGLD